MDLRFIKYHQVGQMQLRLLDVRGRMRGAAVMNTPGMLAVSR
jgi:hypothetical protein